MIDIEATAALLVGLLGIGQSAPMLSGTHPLFDIPTAYRIAAARFGKVAFTAMAPQLAARSGSQITRCGSATT